MFGEELVQAFREFKQAWDPDNGLNPGKVVDAYRADQNLRLGTRYDPPRPATHFQYAADSGNFSRALLRCVGVGECRKKSGTMCPSYMATHEEKHSTRGRARLLFEMSQHQELEGGWHEPAVHEALDLCLSCKGCKGECPVKVDMATYKAEFLSHYYEGRARPLRAHAFGRIDVWSRYAAHAPRLANFLLRTAPFSTVAKKLLQVAGERELTPYAERSFLDWFRAHESMRETGEKVILWPDTFSNYFVPDRAIAAMHVLERAGFQVALPTSSVCCGRPLYEWGMLDIAKRYLRRTLDVMHDDIRDGTPIIVLEPGCASVFKEELGNLFPFDEQAKRLARQVVLLTEFIDKRDDAFRLGRLARKAVVHAHCHHKSVLKTEAYEHVLKKLGLDYTLLDSGCCGMAGSFGFERSKYDVSIRCAERVLLPAIRETDTDTLVLANGFSCREQIRQTVGRPALHIAEVLALANPS
jgi:Fe-S oxidoreductase